MDIVNSLPKEFGLNKSNEKPKLVKIAKSGSLNHYFGNLRNGFVQKSVSEKNIISKIETPNEYPGIKRTPISINNMISLEEYKETAINQADRSE